MTDPVTKQQYVMQNGTMVNYTPTPPTIPPPQTNPITPVPAGTPPTPPPTPPASTSGAGMSDTSFLGLLNNLNSGLQQNNALVDQKNLIQKQMFDQPLTPDELAKLPPDVRSIVQGGNRDQMALQLQIINDSLQGRNNSVAASIQYLTSGYQTAQQRYNTDVSNVLAYAKALNAKPSDVMKALYPSEAAQLGTALDKLAAPLLTTTQIAPITNSIVNIPTGTIAYKTNNPLNIKFTPDNLYGANDSGIQATDGGTFAQFDNPQDGLSAAMQLLQSPLYTDNNMTVEQAMRQWSNGGYGAEVAPGIDPVAYMRDLPQDQIQTLVQDMAKRESGASVNFGGSQIIGTPPDPNDPNSNKPDPQTGITPNALYDASIEYAMTGKMPSLGLGSAPQVRLQRTSIINTAGAIATALGSTFPQLQALYKSNSAAATQNVERLARVESVLNATSLNFPRLEQLADAVKAEGINITEADIQAGSAAVQSKFGSTSAASYVELINTIRSDYSAAQASLAGSRGGQFFAENAQQAIPIGLTSAQYGAIKDTLTLSSQNAAQAINGEVQNLIGTSGGIGSPATNTGGGSYQDYLNAING